LNPASRDASAAFARIATNVSVITVNNEEGPHGCTANVWAEAPDPPVVLITLRRTSATLARILAEGRFAVNVLEASQEGVARQFASRGDRFAGIAFDLGEHRQPLIRDALLSMECAVEGRFAFGAYDIVTGCVTSFHPREPARPLMFYAGRFFGGPATT
jgi:flavin reductase (DIM6/NTAB) family NADH-FMN oxidoreductase RutF